MNDITDLKVYTNSDKTISIKISDDNLSAYLTIEDNGSMIDEKEINSLISSVGIKNGLENAANYNLENKIVKEFGKPFLIAATSLQMANAEILYEFDIESCLNIEDPYEMNALSQYEKVLKDQPLAKISVDNNQNAGVDLFGNALAESADPQVNLEKTLGNNVYYSAETKQILSSVAGYPYFDLENKLCVKSNFISQNIQNVDSIIYGNATIDGVILDSHLEIYGDLWVRGNIKDCRNGGVIVHGDVTLDYAENSKIVASGKITINKNTRNCLIFSNEEIEAGKNSSISGGVIQSGKKLEVFSIGSPLGTLTEVEIAIAPFLKEQIRFFSKKLAIERNDSEINETLISNLAGKLHELHSAFNNELEKLPVTESLMISIKEKIYPNSKIRILQESITISEEKSSINILLNESGLSINEVDRI